MRWRDLRRSKNVQDRRGMRAGPALAGGGLGVVVLALVVMFLGGDPGVVLQTGQGGGAAPPVEAGPPPADDEAAAFIEAVLGSTEDVWNVEFRRDLGEDYPEPTLVLFSGAVQSACGFAQAAVGPFYCPLDRQVYLDLSFFRELSSRFGAPGDFAQAYVVAHEVGHHIQTVLGISDEVRAAQQRARSQTEANEFSVRQELQADCFAGVWARNAQEMQNVLEPGDVEEALGAASAIGDDRLQQQTQGRVVPDSFTHGSSEQRVRWFRRGLEGGDISQCDTFSAQNL